MHKQCTDNKRIKLFCRNAEPTGALCLCDAEKHRATNAEEKRTEFQYRPVLKCDAECEKNSPLVSAQRVFPSYRLYVFWDFCLVEILAIQLVSLGRQVIAEQVYRNVV